MAFDKYQTNEWEVYGKEKCRECGSTNLAENLAAGNVYCQECCLEHRSYTIDYQTEWRTFSDKSRDTADLARVGIPVNLLLSGEELATSLTKSDALLGRLAGGTTIDRKLRKSFKEIEELCDRLNFNIRRVRDRACEVYKKILKAGLRESTRSQTIQAASVLYAARLEGRHSNRTFKEMVLATTIPQKEIARCFRRIKEEFKGVPNLALEATEHPVVSFSKNYAGYLDLPQEWVHAIACVANKARPDTGEEVESQISTSEKTWDGRSRASISATVVYILTRLPRCPKSIDMKTISQRSGVRDSTITACYRDMVPVIYELLDVVPEKIATSDEIKDTFRADLATLVEDRPYS